MPNRPITRLHGQPRGRTKPADNRRWRLRAPYLLRVGTGRGRPTMDGRPVGEHGRHAERQRGLTCVLGDQRME